MITLGIDMKTMKLIRIKNRPSKNRYWYYQHKGEEKQQIVKEGRWWYYNTPTERGGGEVGSDTLDGAKGDLKMYEGTKVWSELE